MSESPYERIDRLQTRGFIGLMTAGFSPVIYDVVSPWVGWPMFFIGLSVFVGSWVAMGERQ